jgi:transaldolase/glucose-6-phosphate isomerase
VLYVEELIASDTVNTMPEATLEAFLDHGRVRPAIQEGLVDAKAVLDRARSEGIDLTAIGMELLEEGLAAFGKDFQRLLDAVAAELGMKPVEANAGRHDE